MSLLTPESPLSPQSRYRKLLHLVGRHALCGHEIQDDAGIDLTGARSHWKPIEGSEAHRALHAAPAVDGTHGSTASQVSDDDTRLRDIGRDPREGLRDVFIGKTVKPVAPDSLIVQPAGYGVVIRDLVVVAVKGRVEAGDLGQRGKVGKQGANGRQIVRLMQRRKRRETLQTRYHAMVDQHGPVVIRTTVHDPVADCERT